MNLTTLYFAIPELIIVGAALLAIAVGLVLADDERAHQVTVAIAIVGAVASFVSLFFLLPDKRLPFDPLAGTFVLDNFAIYIKAILLLFAVITVLMAYR